MKDNIKYVNSSLEAINLSSTKVYKHYLACLDINSLRRIFRYYYQHLSNIECDCILDTRTYYINKILEYFDYDKNLF